MRIEGTLIWLLSLDESAEQMLESREALLQVHGDHAALGGEDEELFAPEFFRLPTHTRILGEAKKIATGFIEEHVAGEGQLALPTMSFGARIGDLLSRTKNIC